MGGENMIMSWTGQTFLIGAVQIIAMARLLVFFMLVLVPYSHGSDWNLHFASYYGDHMVLQKSPARAVLWGYGPEGAQVTVSLYGPVKEETSAATVVKDGTWQVTLDPVEAGGPYSVGAATHNSTANLTDVLFGDVWLCGGQSNMQFHLSQVFNASQEMELAADYPHVRPFMASMKQSNKEETDLIGVDLPWSVPTAGGVATFSAVCWLFGRYMYDTLKYPIGLVESCWGGTPVEAWSSSRALRQCGLDQAVDQSKAFGPHESSVLWNAMIHPLLKMTITGAIWYQGEANAFYQQEKYNCSFPAMIHDWRTAFHQGSGGQTADDFPFGFVQISTYQKDSKFDGFPNIRWHQTADLGNVPNTRMPNTFMAVAMDLPDETAPEPIHPRDKQDVAYRLSLGARAVAYKEKNISFQGPFPSQVLTTLGSVNITYDQEVYVTASEDIFEILCSGVKSTWVLAPIMQWGPTTVQVSASACTDTVSAVRYAWRDWPCDFKACPVYSASRVLPAPPFIIMT